MPSRKQRRRRQKELRHEYEYVYVDGEGREVEVAEPERPAKQEQKERRRNGKQAPGKRKAPASVRKVDPPSWRRVARRAALFAPLIFVAFTVINGKQAIEIRVLLTLFYTAFFIPFMYLMDRAMYRAYLRRIGQAPAPRRVGKRG
jgi:hypothetical protein